MNSFAQTQKIAKEQAAKEVIYEATMKVIAHQEDGPLKMQDIAKTAGIATGTLYNYFKNKVQLLTFVDQRLHKTILNQVEAVSDSELPPAEKLKAVVCEILAFFKQYHIVFDLAEKLGIKTVIPLTEKREGLNQAYSCIACILTEGVAQGQFKKVNIEQTAKHFFSAIVGVIEIKKWLQNYEMTKAADELNEFFLSNLTIPR